MFFFHLTCFRRNSWENNDTSPSCSYSFQTCPHAAWTTGDSSYASASLIGKAAVQLDCVNGFVFSMSQITPQLDTGWFSGKTSPHRFSAHVSRCLWKQNRRDRHHLQDAQHVEARIADAGTVTGHQRSVMIGATNSTACYDKMHGREVRKTCSFRGAQISLWEHLVWHCSSEL